MATPITHFVLSQKIYEKFKLNLDKKDFLLGSLIPDIRYLKVIERNKTHFSNIELKDILYSSVTSSYTGILVHSLIDYKREEFITSKNIYEEIGSYNIAVTALKLLEDYVLYNKINIPKYLNYFDTGFNEDIIFDLQKGDIDRWHSGIKKYFKIPPTDESRIELGLFFGVSREMMNDINVKMNALKQNKMLIQYIDKLYANIDSILK